MDGKYTAQRAMATGDVFKSINHKLKPSDELPGFFYDQKYSYYWLDISEQLVTPEGLPLTLVCSRHENSNSLSCRTNYIIKGNVHIEYSMRLNSSTAYEDVKKYYNKVTDFLQLAGVI